MYIAMNGNDVQSTSLRSLLYNIYDRTAASFDDAESAIGSLSSRMIAVDRHLMDRS